MRRSLNQSHTCPTCVDERAQLDNTLFEKNPVRCGTVVAVAANLAYFLASLLHPFMPRASEELLKQLNAPVRSTRGILWSIRAGTAERSRSHADG